MKKNRGIKAFKTLIALLPAPMAFLIMMTYAVENWTKARPLPLTMIFIGTLTFLAVEGLIVYPETQHYKFLKILATIGLLYLVVVGLILTMACLF